MKLLDLLDRGHCVQLEKRRNGYEIVVFEHVALKDHHHAEGESLPEAMESAHDAALARWPKEDD